jgi:hypothetical protein
MLERFSIKDKILAFNGDNATLNDTQTTKLHNMGNAFHEENHVKCFNHMVQLLAKALLKPFCSCIMTATTDDEPAELEMIPDLEVSEDEDEDEENEEEDDDGESIDDEVDELEMMSQEDHANLLEETAAVKQTISKVSSI